MGLFPQPVRLWASVCLALYVAFWLELDNAYWAGTTAATVCQPHLGASLRKGWYRMIGTVIGAVAIVVLTACFPQDRAPFLVGLALWCSASAFVATLLRNVAAYAAALAGYTTAIIALDQLGATGGPNGQAFMLAVYRATEICIGIVCAGVVLAGLTQQPELSALAGHAYLTTRGREADQTDRLASQPLPKLTRINLSGAERRLGCFKARGQDEGGVSERPSGGSSGARAAVHRHERSIWPWLR